MALTFAITVRLMDICSGKTLKLKREIKPTVEFPKTALVETENKIGIKLSGKIDALLHDKV